MSARLPSVPYDTSKWPVVGYMKDSGVGLVIGGGNSIPPQHREAYRALVAEETNPANGDIRCPRDGEWMNKRCWKCGLHREDLEVLPPKCPGDCGGCIVCMP